MNKYDPGVIWIVAKVESGIPVSAEVFSDETAARHRESQLRAAMNAENDEVGVFSSKLPKGSLLRKSHTKK